MPERILPQSIRGLANAFGFPGGKTGPAGVDLAIQPQTVVDLTAFARYGSARLSPSADGWLGVGITAVGGGAAVVSNAFVTVDATTFPWIQPGDVFWIRRASIEVNVSVAYADFGNANVVLQPAVAQALGPGLGTRIVLAGGVSADQLYLSATASMVGNRVEPSGAGAWLAAPQGSVITLSLYQAAAAGTCNALAFVYGRVLPAGVSPEG